MEGDRQVPGDQRTARVVQEIANSISPNTSLSVDFPSAHQSGWMPVLDIQVKVASDNTIDWLFYKKPVSSPYFILNRSAMPAKDKRVCLVQECLRRLRNTRPSLVEANKVERMEEAGEMMMRSGYPEELRAGVLESALVGYRRQVEKSERGETPLYRPRGWREGERRRRKQIKKSAWFRPSDSVLFCPATPNSELAARQRKVVEEEGRRLGVKVRVVERAGMSMRQQLVRTDLSAHAPCPQPDCYLCITNPGMGGGLKHHRSGALYTGVCKICPEDDFTAIYTGESGYSGYTRTREHHACILSRDQSNAFSKHLAEHHPTRQGDVMAFTFKVLRTFNRPLLRLIWEAVLIHGTEATFIMNSRAEWHQPAIDRVVVTREPPTSQGGAGGAGGGGGRTRGR